MASIGEVLQHDLLTEITAGRAKTISILFVTSQHKLRTIAHVGTLYQPLRGRFAEQIGGDNIN